MKKTGLGTGRFATTRLDFVAVDDATVGEDDDPAELMARGEAVATMRFRILKYAPPAEESSDREVEHASTAATSACHHPRHCVLV